MSESLDTVALIQTISTNSLFVARQNSPITSIDTEVILSSWKELADALLVIGSKEMIWIICFVSESFELPAGCCLESIILLQFNLDTKKARRTTVLDKLPASKHSEYYHKINCNWYFRTYSSIRQRGQCLELSTKRY